MTEQPEPITNEDMIWEIRFTGNPYWHKVRFGNLEKFLLDKREKLSNVQEIKVGYIV